MVAGSKQHGTLAGNWRFESELGGWLGGWLACCTASCLTSTDAKRLMAEGGSRQDSAQPGPP